jgi:mutator protein MutT
VLPVPSRVKDRPFYAGPVDRTQVPCVGAIIEDDRGRLLLIRRGQEPARGTWSIPGGRVEAGETDAEALAREVREETGLAVDVGDLVGTVERAGPGGSVYLIRDYRCTPAAGTATEPLTAGDDATEAGWFEPAQVRRLTCAPGLVTTLTSWDVLR